MQRALCGAEDDLDDDWNCKKVYLNDEDCHFGRLYGIA
jgi:hypothetical protein